MKQLKGKKKTQKKQISKIEKKRKQKNYLQKRNVPLEGMEQMFL